MWPNWLIEKVADGDVTPNEVVFWLGAAVTLLWACQFLKPLRTWYKVWWKRK